MKVISEQILNVLYELTLEAVAGHNLPSAAVLLSPNGDIEVALPSRVASDKHALSHADLQVINEGCRKLNSISLRGYSVVSVFEPSLMTISACYWASIAEIVFIVPAKPYVAQIPWASEGIELSQKESLARTFLEPVSVTRIIDSSRRFEKLCDQYVATVINKE